MPEAPMEETVTVPEHQRARKKKKDTSKYPRTIEIIPVSDEDRQCTCGCEKTVIRYEISELFDYEPARFTIVEKRREVMACPKGCAGEIITAPAPKHVLPKSKVTERLLSHIIISKFHHRQPLYHLEKYALSVAISRETMSRWLIQLVRPLQPIINLMKDEVI